MEGARSESFSNVSKLFDVQKRVEYSVAFQVLRQPEDGVNKARSSVPLFLGHGSEHVIGVNEV